MSSRSASQADEFDPGAVLSLLTEACAEALPNWLETRRWFADKGRGISKVAIEDALVNRVGLDWLALTVARGLSERLGAGTAPRPPAARGQAARKAQA